MMLDQAIKQYFLEDWLMNWIKPIHREGDTNLVSTIMVSSVMAKLCSTIMKQKISSWVEHHHKPHFVKQALDQNIRLWSIWLH